MVTLLPLLCIKEEKRQSATRLERLQAVGSAVKSTLVQKLIVINALVGIGAGMIGPFFNIYFHNVLWAACCWNTV